MRQKQQQGIQALLRLLLLCGLTCLIASCGANGPDAPFKIYVERLGSTLSIAAPEFHGTTSPRPPRSGALQLDLPGSRLDTLDFLALSGCALQVTIGKRNSSLGRMARPSQRLLLELEYLRLAPACINHLRQQQRAKLADMLAQSWHNKRAQLPAGIFNATLGGEEYRALWLPTAAIADYPPVPATATLNALAAINGHTRRWLQGDYETDNREFEILLSEVAGGNGGRLLKALLHQRDWLDSADRMLQTSRQRGPLCAPGIRHRAADILPNVVQRYFIDGIQPGAAAMSQHYYQLLPNVTTLEKRLEGVMPADYRAWMQQRNRLFSEAIAAPRHHVAQLQQVLQPCEQPGTVPNSR